MAKWLLPPRSGAIFRTSTGRVYTGTAAVPTNFEDVDAPLAVIDGWSYSSTQALPAQGEQTPIIANYKVDSFGNINGLGNPAGLTITLGQVAIGTCALLGDSRNDQFSSGTAIGAGLGRTKTAVHWLNWYNALNNQPLICTSKYAVSGTQTSALDGQITQMAAIAPLPQFAFIWSGVNDFAVAITSATAFANISAACSRLIGMGITPVIFLETGAGSQATSALIQTLFDYNERLRNLGEANRKILVFDTTSVIWDPTGAAWTATPAVVFKTGYSSDTLHLSNLGGYNLGVAFGAWFANRVAPFDSRPVCIGEMVNANNPLTYLVNGLFTTTTGGAQTGTGALTGTVPASWSYNKGANAATATTMTTPAGSFGNDLTLVITTTVADTTKLSQDTATGIRTGTAIGTILQAGCEIVVTAGTNLQGVNMIHEYNDGSSTTYFDMYCQNASAGNGPQAYTIQMQPLPMIIATTPSSWITIKLEFVFSGAGGATIVVRRARYRKRYN